MTDERGGATRATAALTDAGAKVEVPRIEVDHSVDLQRGGDSATVATPPPPPRKRTPARKSTAKKKAPARSTQPSATDEPGADTSGTTASVETDAAVSEPQTPASVTDAAESDDVPVTHRPIEDITPHADGAEPADDDASDPTEAPAEQNASADDAVSIAPASAPEASRTAPTETDPSTSEAPAATAPRPQRRAAASPTFVPKPSPKVDPSAAALVARGLQKNFGGVAAVDGIDLTVPAGTFYGLVGPNGAGKTTTLSMIAGLLRPDSGTISVCGVDARKDSRAAKRLLGVLPDRFRTFDRLTGRQLLHYYGVLRGLPAAVVDERAADLARAFDLTDALGRVVSDYSAGMTKKVMLAGALIHTPRLLVLDEPFESVDPVSSAVILEILTSYVSGGGTVILSSHGMGLVEKVCSRVAVVVGGQVLAEGTVDDVRGGVSLEERFVELSGGLGEVEGLEWLHTFSG